MNKPLLHIWYLVALAIMVVLTGCQFSSKPDPEDIVGHWIERSVNNSTSNVSGCFEFFEDGRFEAKNIPSEQFIQKGYSPKRIDTNGTWVLDTSSDDPFAVHRIELMFAPIKGFPLGLESILYISMDGDLLFHGIDNRVLFMKGECK